MVGLLFPGQGSQFVGMGRDLAERYDEARAVFEAADDALGLALSRLMWDGPEAELTETRNAQPAILVHSVAVYRLVRERLGQIGCAAGHSLGEFTAYVAADAMTFEAAVKTVRRRGELMFRAGQDRPGTMAAVLGLDDDVVERVCEQASDRGGECVAANFNAPGQVVISGDRPTVQVALELAKQAGARRALPLNVSGAFHSPLMTAAKAGLEAQLETVALEHPAFPVVSNATAEPVRDRVDARRLLVAQLTAPVHWAASMRRMREEGVERMVELGPGNVLAGLMKRIDRAVPVTSVGSADEVEALLEAA